MPEPKRIKIPVELVGKTIVAVNDTWSGALGLRFEDGSFCWIEADDDDGPFLTWTATPNAEDLHKLGLVDEATYQVARERKAAFARAWKRRVFERLKAELEAEGGA